MANGDAPQAQRLQQQAAASVGDPLAGFKSGLDVARGIQDIDIRKSKNEEQKKSFKLKSMDLISSRMKQALLAPKGLRKALLKKAQSESEVLGIPWDPANVELFSNDDLRNDILLSLQERNGLSEEDQLANFDSSVIGLGDSRKMAENFFAARELRNQNAKKAQAGQISEKDRADLVLKFQDQLRADPKAREDATIVTQGNNIMRLASDPLARRQAFAADSAKVQFSKILDPIGVVREGEISRLTGLNVGVVRQAKDAAKKLLSGDVLNDAQWIQLAMVVDGMARAAQRRQNARVESLGPTLQRTGVDASEVEFSERFKTFDFQDSFGDTDQPEAARLLQQVTKRSKLTSEVRELNDAGINITENQLRKLSPATRAFLRENPEQAIPVIAQLRAQSKQRTRQTAKAQRIGSAATKRQGK